MDSNNINAALQNNGEAAAGLNLRRLSLFSSGVGFFEHSGDVSGSAEFALTFNKDAVNDALKSIVISDPDSSPSVHYHADDTLERTLNGLSVDLHGNRHAAQLLNSLQGAEIEVFTPKPIIGRILLVEYRLLREPKGAPAETVERDAFLSLLTPSGVRIIALKEVSGFRFTDPKINADANRALDLIMRSRDTDTRDLTVKLPGGNCRKVSISYVIPAPVWKVSYRLDLSQKEPFIQGWAIVDNDSDTDWDKVELALVTGKPVSFIQDLYAPYHLPRPTLGIAIAGIAEADTYDSGTARKTRHTRRQATASGGSGDILSQSEVDSLLKCVSGGSSYNDTDAFYMSAGSVDTAWGRVAGDQFEFTIKTPVSIARRQSAMLPLVEGSVRAEKMLVFSDDRVPFPAIGAELVNNTGMKLPAGAITVYDGGTYAGDALIAFFPEGDRRIISYGEDLSVTGSYTETQNHMFSAVTISGGGMEIKQQFTHRRVYTFINAASETKRLIVEHPFAPGYAELIEPCEYMEKTSSVYRFELNLPPGETVFTVKEEEPRVRVINLTTLPRADFIHYASNQDFPETARAILRRANELKEKISEETEKLSDLNTKLKHLYAEQERTRNNLKAAGPQSQQGQHYLVRLAEQDDEIDGTSKAISAAEQAEKDAQSAYGQYIDEMSFGA